MLTRTWAYVAATVIINCFKKTRFLKDFRMKLSLVSVIRLVISDIKLKSYKGETSLSFLVSQ